MAGDAEAALGSLTWDRGLQAITQHGLQAFLWHELPRKWLTDRRQAAHRRFAGAVLELVGLARYTAICRGPQTAAVLQPTRAAAGRASGSAAGRRSAPGWSCPTCPGRGCGSPGGRWWAREAGAFVSVAAALELAVAGGKLRPGARSWRAAQQAVARRHLAAAGPELDGWSWLVVVVAAAAAERLSAWARGRGEARRALVDPVLPRLAGRPLLPVPVPPGGEEALAPLRWLLTRAGEGRGIALTRSSTSPSNRDRGGPPLWLAPAAGPAARRGRRLRAVNAARFGPRSWRGASLGTAADGHAPAGPWPATPRRCGMRSRTGSAGATTSPRWSPNWRCCYCWGRPARSPRRRWWRRSALGRWVRAGQGPIAGP
jgi:hypothetical protein